MGKISPVSAKYIIQASISIEGVVDKPDVIGAVFGQTEGLLGAELELRELQRSGRIGRIEVNTETKGGKTSGMINVPSSLDKAETSIVAAALEVIQRIGPCNAKIHVEKIEDVRVSKRSYVVERAKTLLKNLMEQSMPDSQELADEVTYSVRVMEIQEYGRDRLPAGPAVEESDDIIIVEGRADVVNLLKYGIKNAIAINGTSVPESIVDLSRKKVVTAFVDGDRGGDLILKELIALTDIDYVTKAPDGKEVEELTKKEIHMALRARVAPEQVKLDRQQDGNRFEKKPLPPQQERKPYPQRPSPLPLRKPDSPPSGISDSEKAAFRKMSEELLGTRGAYMLDDKLNILGKVPVTEIKSMLKELSSVHAVVFDGIIDRELVSVAESAGVKFLIAMDSRVKPGEARLAIATINEL